MVRGMIVDQVAKTRRLLRTLGIPEGPYETQAADLLQEVLRAAEQVVSLSELAHITGTGTHPGLFWHYVGHLQKIGLLEPVPDAEVRTYRLGEPGRVLLASMILIGDRLWDEE